MPRTACGTAPPFSVVPGSPGRGLTKSPCAHLPRVDGIILRACSGAYKKVDTRRLNSDVATLPQICPNSCDGSRDCLKQFSSSGDLPSRACGFCRSCHMLCGIRKGRKRSGLLTSGRCARKTDRRDFPYGADRRIEGNADGSFPLGIAIQPHPDCQCLHHCPTSVGATRCLPR